MNAFVLILMLVCGEPVAMSGWGLPAGIGPFFGGMDWIEQDEEANASVQLLLQHPDTQRVQFEMVVEEDRKFKCGVGA